MGGANLIDKIQCNKKIGCDIHKELIALLKKAQTAPENIPDRILEDEYYKVKNNRDSYESWYVGLVGFCASFGAKYFGGYARDSRDDNSGKWSAGAITNLKKQAAFLKDISFINIDFREIPKNKLKGYVIYCDIPYRDTTKYSTKKFPYDDFYDWAKEISIENVVLISEYNMPVDYKCIWVKEQKTLLDSNKTSNDKDNTRFEGLFTYQNGLAAQIIEHRKINENTKKITA